MKLLGNEDPASDWQLFLFPIRQGRNHTPPSIQRNVGVANIYVRNIKLSRRFELSTIRTYDRYLLGGAFPIATRHGKIRHDVDGTADLESIQNRKKFDAAHGTLALKSINRMWAGCRLSNFGYQSTSHALHMQVFSPIVSSMLKFPQRCPTIEELSPTRLEADGGHVGLKSKTSGNERERRLTMFASLIIWNRVA